MLRSSSSEPQSVSGLVFADCVVVLINMLIFNLDTFLKPWDWELEVLKPPSWCWWIVAQHPSVHFPCVVLSLYPRTKLYLFPRTKLFLCYSHIPQPGSLIHHHFLDFTKEFAHHTSPNSNVTRTIKFNIIQYLFQIIDLKKYCLI